VASIFWGSFEESLREALVQSKAAGVQETFG